MFLSIRDDQIPAAGYPSFIAGLDDLGVHAVEMAMDREYRIRNLEGEPLDLSTDEGKDAIANTWKDRGIRVTSFLLANDFGRENLDAEIGWVTNVVRIAHELGIPAVRIDAIMHGETDRPLEARQQHFADCMKRVLADTADCAVDCGIENHGRQGNDPDFLMGLIDRVGSARLGLTMDMGNFYWAGHPIEKVYEVLAWAAPLTVHTHIKNINYPEDKRNVSREMGWEYGQYVCPLAQGDIDLGRVIGLLRDTGYDRDLCIEDESLGKFEGEERKRVLREDVEFVRGFVQ